MSDVGEFELIRLLLDIVGPQPVEVGLGARMLLAAGDDCAVLEPSAGACSVHTTDTMVEGIHFLPQMAPRSIGWKLLASNVSDAAAMGALPAAALVTLVLPGDLPIEWLKQLYQGLAECGTAFNTTIVGGDIVRSRGELVLTVSLVGEVERRRLATRSGARLGDCLLVTGTPGDSSAGLALILAGEPVPNRLENAHLRPAPRVVEAREAIRCGDVHAMIDLSDGLGGDLRHLCQASRTGGEIDEARLPMSTEMREAAARLRRSPLEFALSGGEDYELLLAVEPASAERICSAVSQATSTPTTIIGKMVEEESGVSLITADGLRGPLPAGFEHF